MRIRSTDVLRGAGGSTGSSTRCWTSPDIIADVDGHFLAIEAKTKTGRQSEQQKVCQRQVEASGGMYIVARCLQDVVEAVASLRKTS